MPGKPNRRVSALDGWGTCETKALFEDVARWKGKGFRFQPFKDADGAAAAFIKDNRGIIMYQLSPRRAAAVSEIWNDVPADRHDNREEK